MLDLSIIIVSYNTKDLLIECIKSIIDTSREISYEIIVVDNASTDASASVISNFQFPRLSSRRAPSSAPISNIKLIKNEKNLGFSKANNIGIKQSKGRYILFLNSDTVVYSETLKTMVEFMDKNQTAGAATCKVVLPNGKLDDACHRGFPTPWNSFCHFSGLSQIFPRSRIFADYSLGWKDVSKTHEIDACCGAFMIVRREAGEKINWWDENYFWYGEDLDFCFKLKQKDWKIYFVPQVSILHYKGASGGIKKTSENLTKASEETKILAQKARFNAMRIFYKKHYQKTYPKVITNIVLTGIFLKEKLTV